MRQKGIVKWYNFEKGIGFVSTVVNGENTDNVLLHYLQLKDCDSLESGQEIEFDLITTDRGHSALNIMLIKEVDKERSDEVKMSGKKITAKQALREIQSLEIMFIGSRDELHKEIDRIIAMVK